MILPTDARVKEVLWEHIAYDAAVDSIQILYSEAIDANKPQTEEEFDELYDAVTNRFYEVVQ